MKPGIGFTCAYTPLPLIEAAGFAPFRILPSTSAMDQAGSMLHDNMCPHVKRVLDRALSGDLAELEGVVFMNSCESMRRLADAWQIARPSDRVFVVDLPSTSGAESTAFLARQLARLWENLAGRPGGAAAGESIRSAVERYNELAKKLVRLERLIARGAPAGGRSLLQEVYNRSVTRPVTDTIAEIERVESSLDREGAPGAAVPVYLFGNVLFDREAFDLLERSGCRIAGDSLCTGSRQIVPLGFSGGADPFTALAAALLDRPPCARAMDQNHPGRLAAHAVEEAKTYGARAVIIHVMKFCDPFLARLPAVQEALSRAGLPTLVLEGDCTLRSLGQSRTRIEAFVEMLGGARP
jgi:benzoyl-CoA reductase/2-hydroxyglutaryl-CoA dehydratase subunit BcrC/BadD/HgdB